MSLLNNWNISWSSRRDCPSIFCCQESRFLGPWSPCCEKVNPSSASSTSSLTIMGKHWGDFKEKYHICSIRMYTYTNVCSFTRMDVQRSREIDADPKVIQVIKAVFFCRLDPSDANFDVNFLVQLADCMFSGMHIIYLMQLRCVLRERWVGANGKTVARMNSVRHGKRTNWQMTTAPKTCHCPTERGTFNL